MNTPNDTASQATESTVSAKEAATSLFDHFSGPDGRGVEVRKIDGKAVYSLYVDNKTDFFNAVADGSPYSASGNTYVTINRLRDGVTARNLDKFLLNPRATSDADIERYVTFPIDIDPVRLSGISATDEELQLAYDTAGQIADFLDGQGWPKPLYDGVSGNGATIFYKINLPNTPETVESVKGALEALSQRFSTNAVTVDTSIYNPSRIMKVPGTVARKGSHTEKRPHRRATPVSLNPDTGVVTADQLAALAAMDSKSGSKASSNGQTPPRQKSRSAKETPRQLEKVAMIEQALTDRGISHKRKQGENAILIVSDACFTSDAHDDSGYFWVGPSGRWGYGCQHESCTALGDEALTARAAEALGIPVPGESGADSGDAEYHAADDYWYVVPENRYILRANRKLIVGQAVNRKVRPIPTGRTHTTGAKKGEEVFEPASEWIARRRSVDDMTWWPGQPEIIDNRVFSVGGLRVAPGKRVFNEYVPPTIGAGDAGRAGRWTDHVRFLFPNEAEELFDWLAHRVQYPGVKVNHALVLGGSPGIGKDTVIYPIRVAVGEWNVSEATPSQMTEQFNPYVKAVILRVSELRDLGEGNRIGFYNHMKPIIAAPPEVLSVNDKHVQRYSVPNLVGVVYTTNERLGGMHLDDDDRRHFCCWSDRTSADIRDGYFSDLYAWLDAEGSAHVAAFLRERDLSRFNPKAEPRKTAWFRELVASGRSSEEGGITSVIEAMGNPPAVTIAQIKAKAGDLGKVADDADADVLSVGKFSEEVYEFLSDQRRSAKQIPHVMLRAGYIALQNPNAPKSGRWKVGGRDTVIYVLKDLTIREQMDAAVALTREPTNVRPNPYGTRRNREKTS